MNKNKTPIAYLPYTGERFTPETHGDIELEHLHRYALACELTSGRTILDIACGEGYGSAMLAKKAKMVFGVDISKDAIRHAKKRYRKRNIEFKVGNCSDIPLTDGSVDYVVSFETIEHHDKHILMMKEIKRVLRPGGILLISSPDKSNYSDKPCYNNECHVKELYENEFKRLIKTYFKRSAFFGQRVLYGSGIFADSLSTRSKGFNQNKCASISNNKGLSHPIYWIAIASDAEIPILPSGIFERPIDRSDYARTLSDRLNETKASLTAVIRDKDVRIANLDRTINDKDALVSNLEDTLRRLESSLVYKAGKIIAMPYIAMREYFDRISITIKNSSLFNKNRISKVPEEFGFLGYLDSPNDNAKCVKCAGWFVSKKPLLKVELFIGDKKIAALKRNIVSKDVDGAIKGYRSIRKKGFDYVIPEPVLSSLKNKKRTIFIRFYIDAKRYVDKFHTIARS